jgi:hypothetical protein
LAKHQNGSETTTFSQQNLSLLFLSAILIKAMKTIVQAKQHFWSPSWNSSSLAPGKSGNKETTSSLIRGHPYFDSWRQHFSEHWMEDWKRKVESGKMAGASELGLDNISFPF